jgi:hypothetical protein
MRLQVHCYSGVLVLQWSYNGVTVVSCAYKCTLGGVWLSLVLLLLLIPFNKNVPLNALLELAIYSHYATMILTLQAFSHCYMFTTQQDVESRDPMVPLDALLELNEPVHVYLVREDPGGRLALLAYASTHSTAQHSPCVT